MNDLQWSEVHPNGVNYKAIDTSFLADMSGDFCDGELTVEWRHFSCLRLPGHTGRHVALELKCRYPVAVWR